MNRTLTIVVAAGWLLVTKQGGPIAFYDTKADCEFAIPYAPDNTTRCIPDRFAVEEMRRSQETKP